MHSDVVCDDHLFYVDNKGMLYMNYTNSISFEDLIACVLSGAVAITAGCYTVSWWASVVIGFASSFLYFWALWWVRRRLRIDDPLGVTPVHLFCGYFGCFAEGLFAVCCCIESGSF